MMELDSKGSSEDRDSTTTEEYNLITQQQCSAPRAKLFLVFILSFVLATVIVLLVVVTRVEKPETLVDEDEEQCADVAIIGAGLAGAYATWRMREHNLTIHVYELSSRIGGKLYTQQIGHFSEAGLEYGAAYFLPGLHPLMNATVQELGLAATSYWPDDQTRDLIYHLRGKNYRQEDIRTGSAPYHVHASERGLYPIELFRKILVPDDLMSYSKEILDNTTVPAPSSNTTDDRHKPWSKSVRRVVLERASYEAYRYLGDTLDMPFYYEDGDADVFSEFLGAFDSASSPPESFTRRCTLEGGMNTLPRRLIDEAVKANSKITVKLQQKLTTLESTPEQHNLHFTEPSDPEKGVTVQCAKTVVLALPPEALLQLELTPSATRTVLASHLNALTDVPAIKMFVLYSTAWWRHCDLSWTVAKSDLPVETVVEVTSDVVITVNSNASQSFAILQVTASASNVEYWQYLLEDRDIFVPSVNKTLTVGNTNPTVRLVSQLHRHLSELASFENSSLSGIPFPLDVSLWDWSKAGTGKGWQIWRNQVNRTMIGEAFLKPLDDVTLHVIGASYATDFQQMWGEGALQTVDSLIRQNFYKRSA